MFLLSLVAVVWTCVVAMSVYDAIMETQNQLTFHLHNASVVLYSRVLDNIYRKEITDGFPQTLTEGAVAIEVAPLLSMCLEKQLDASHVIFPMYIDMCYSLQKREAWSWRRWLGWIPPRPAVTRYRCMYQVPCGSSTLVYPPVTLSPSLYTSTHLHSGPAPVQRVNLVMRYMSGQVIRRQLSCIVTSKILELQGPACDYHKSALSGYQLQKQILVIVLLNELSTMLQTLFGTSEDKLNRSSSPQPPPKSHIPSPLCSDNLIIRLRFHLSNGRVDVINLDDCLAI